MICKIYVLELQSAPLILNPPSKLNRSQFGNPDVVRE